MTQTPKTTEALLASAQDIILSEQENAQMKAELLVYAAQHKPLQREVPVHSPYSFVTIRMWASALATMVFVVAGTGYAASVSLPGDILYGVKVDVLEPAVGLTHFNESSRLSYNVDLIERRLSEVERLVAEEAVTEENAELLGNQLAAHVAHIDSIVTADLDGSIPAHTALKHISDAVSLTEAHERLLKPLFATSSEEVPIQDSQDAIADLYHEELDTFVTSEGAESVTKYLEAVLDEVSDSVALASTTASSTIADIAELITEAEAALDEGALDDALLFAGAAEQQLEVIEYVDAVHGERLEAVLDTE